MAAKRKRGRKKTTNAAARKPAVSTSSKKRGRKRHNPAVAKFTMNGKRGKARVGYRRHNPDGVPASLEPTNINNALHYVGGTAAGALGVPLIGTVLNKQFGLTGAVKYGAQGVATFLLYYFGKKYAPKLALSFLIGGIGVTMYQYFQESGILEGTEQLLGLSGNSPNFTSLDRMNLSRMANNINQSRLNGGISYVPGRNLMGRIVQNNQRAQLNGIAVTSNMRTGASFDGSRRMR